MQVGRTQDDDNEEMAVQLEKLAALLRTGAVKECNELPELERLLVFARDNPDARFYLRIDLSTHIGG